MYTFLAILALLASVVILVGYVPPIRRAVVTRGLFTWYKKVLPPMSSTEREAIYAGDTWHEADLFQGRPNWDSLLANPKPTLTAAEQKFIDTEVVELCNLLDEWQVTHHDLDLPKNVWQFIKDKGFFGLHIPKAYGGMEFSALASSTIVQKIATKSLSASVTVMVPNSLGPAELLLEYGTDTQREKYLHRLATGAEIPCFGLTAPDAGSDASSIIDSGIITRGDYGKEKNILGIKLNFHKRYITLAPIATLIGLAVKLYDPEKLLGDKQDLGITVVLVPRDVPGIDIGKRHFPLNQGFMNGPIRGDGIFVPLDAIIGGPERIGRGWQMLVECLAAGRGVSLPAIGAAVAKHCYRTTGAYAKLRRQFNLSIGKFEGVADVLANIGGYTYLLEATRRLTCGAIDQKHKPSVITAICKYHMTEIGRKIINDSMDIHAGRGIQLGPHNYLGRYYEGVPVCITVEGANILTRCLMIFGQGAIRCHPYVLQEMEAVASDDVYAFDKAMAKHIGYVIKNFLRLEGHAITGTLLCSKPAKTRWSYYYRQLSFMSVGLAVTSDLSMLILGGSLKRKENLSARLGDILSYLYLASAILKYSHDHHDSDEDAKYVKWSLDYCLQQIHQAFLYFTLNFPNKFIGTYLRWVIIPSWRNYKLPKDSDGLKIAEHMMQPSEFRERLTSDCIDNGIELAWRKMLEVEPLLKKIDKAIKDNLIKKHDLFANKIAVAVQHNLITTTEAQQLQEFEEMRVDAMRVDEFTNAELTGKKR